MQYNTITLTFHKILYITDNSQIKNNFTNKYVHTRFGVRKDLNNIIHTIY